MKLQETSDNATCTMLIFLVTLFMFQCVNASIDMDTVALPTQDAQATEVRISSWYIQGDGKQKHDRNFLIPWLTDI